MPVLIEFLKKIITNPKFEAVVIIYLSNLINKKFKVMEEETTKINEPLFLPRGTVRALLALILLCTSIADFIMSSWTLPVEYHVMTVAVVAYYLGYRSDNAQIKEIKF